MTTSTKGASTEARDVRTPTRDRYITCAVKINGAENGRTEILDTMTDGGEGEPLIVASFFDRNTAEMFCRAANALPGRTAALNAALEEIRSDRVNLFSSEFCGDYESDLYVNGTVNEETIPEEVARRELGRLDALIAELEAAIAKAGGREVARG